MHWENAFDTMTKRDLANRKSLAVAAVLNTDADTFKDLDAFFVAFLDLHVDFHCIARFEFRNIRSQLLCFDHVEYIHDCLTLVNPACSLLSSDGLLHLATF